MDIAMPDNVAPSVALLIEGILKDDFPSHFKGVGSVTDAVLSALVGSSKERLGPVPSDDRLTEMKAVIATAIAAEEPIKLLMPWGSKKPDNGTVDVAEIGALKTLEALQRRVQSVYPAGIHLRMRIEDLSGDYLFREEGEEALKASARYVHDFVNLLKLMHLPFIEPVLEKKMMDCHVYNALADELRPVFLTYIENTDRYFIIDDPSVASWQELSRLGWTGFIPCEMRNFYRSRYARQGLSPQEQNFKLAGYLASILARIKLKGYGHERWGKEFINVSFAPPVPGTPEPFAQRRLYYRTLPESMARTHLPPWRGRGYLLISGEEITLKLTTPDGLPEDLIPGTLTYSEPMNPVYVTVRADRLVV